MKSNKSKKEKSIDFEMEHLKEHLNSSFDFNNIKVSEELFEKTLNAVNTGTAPKVTPSDANDYVAAPKVTPSDANDYVAAPKVTPSDANDYVAAPKVTPSDANDYVAAPKVTPSDANDYVATPKITPSDANDYVAMPKITPSDVNVYDKAKKDSTDDTKRKKKFQIFKFAGAAAAVVILVIGINKIQDNLFMGKKDTSAPNSTMDLAAEKSIADEVTAEDKDENTTTNAETEGSTATQSLEDSENNETSLEISQNKKMKENRVPSDVSVKTAAESKEENDAVKQETDTEAIDTFGTTSESQFTTDTASDSESVMDNQINYSLNSITQNASDSKSFAKQDNSTNYPIKVTDYIILEDIYQLSFYDQYESNNIDGTNEKKYTTNSDVIKEFYQLLNECTFTESDDISGDLYYEIVILSKNKEQSYTINIKDGIQLRYQDKLHPEYDYQVNMQGSTEKIKNWIDKYLE